MLTNAKLRHEHDPAVRKFQRVMMYVRLVIVDLAETCDSVSDPTKTEVREYPGERMAARGLADKRQLSARLQAHCHLRFSDRREPTRERVGKVRGH
jgi:hypothetical protein